MKKEKQEKKKLNERPCSLIAKSLIFHCTLIQKERKKERNCKTSSFSLSLRLHFEVHKRIWLQHICAEAVLHCVVLHF